MRPGVYWNPAPFIATVRSNAIARIRQAVVLAVATAKTNMQELGTGVHSEPKAWPAVQSGTLRSEITFEIEISGSEVIGRFGVFATTASGTFLEYAYYLEVGTSRMEPRPWLTLTVDEIMDQVKVFLGAS